MIGIVENGDSITIDIPNCTLTLNVPQEEIDRRMASFKPKTKELKGYLKRYAKNVSSAAKGAILD